ncbi:MAG TPA: DUF4173 domain-containing protein [Pyrinomonadaceae bacterium]
MHIILAALLLGVLGDALLRATPWGLNFFLWTCAGLCATVALLEHGRRVTALKSDGGWLLLAVIVFSAAFAWRDSATLKWLDASAVACCFALLAWRASGARLRCAGLAGYARGIGLAGLHALGGIVPLVCADVKWRTIPRNGVTRHALAVLRGMLIAVPIMLVFGGLFMAADAIFAGLINRTFQFDEESLISHGLLASVFSWLTAGYFRGLLFAGAPDAAATATLSYGQVPATPTPGVDLTTGPRTPPASVTSAPNGMPEHARRVESWRREDAPERSDDTGAQPESVESAQTERAAAEQTQTAPAGSAATGGDKTDGALPPPFVAPSAPRFTLGAVEVGVVLGLLNALFLAFVCVQVRYLFGGGAWVVATSGLTYAEYARRGFFELCWATALALPLLLALHWLLRADDKLAGRLFRVLALAQLALLFVVIASAITRMRLYQSEYGLTELRLYTTAFMGWLALVFVWFAATVLRGARARFACAALVAAGFVIAALHIVNPDATIVRTNVAQARRGHAFDAAYATTLSADATPALVQALPALAQTERCLAARELLAQWSAQRKTGWRSWSVARSDAWRAVTANEPALRAWACALQVETQLPVADTGSSAPASSSATGGTLLVAPPVAPAVAPPVAPLHAAPPAGARQGAAKGRVRW